MKVELVSIGDEILKGETVNTNAPFLARLLKAEGYDIGRHIVLPDDELVMVAELQNSLDRSDIVIVTGGLGPTVDDLTKKAASKLFASPLKLKEELFAELKSRFGTKNITIEEQATLPQDALLLKNGIGTATGLVLQKGEKICCFLPGVPCEMEEMAEKELLPYLKSKLPSREKFFVEQLSFFLLSEAEIDDALKKMVKKGISLGIYPQPGAVKVVLSCSEEKRVEDLKLCAVRLQKKFEPQAFSLEGKSMEEAILEELVEHGQRLVIAESCTGGALSAQLTSVAGASKYFLGSLVAYSNELKKKVLGVTEKSLSEKGAVSSEAVSEMLSGAFALCPQADWAIAVSGLAGPGGGSPKKPVGSVILGIQKRGKEAKIFTFEFPGGRKTVIKYSVNYALACFLRELYE